MNVILARVLIGYTAKPRGEHFLLDLKMATTNSQEIVNLFTFFKLCNKLKVWK